MPWAEHWQAGLLGSCWAPSGTRRVSGFGGSAAAGKAKPGEPCHLHCVLRATPRAVGDPRPPYLGAGRGSGVAGVEVLRRWAKVRRVVRTWDTHKDVRTGPQKSPGPCPSQLQPLPLLQGACLPLYEYS